MMSELPRCSCGCSVSKDQLAKLLTLFCFLGTDVLYSLLTSVLLFHTDFQFPLYLALCHTLLIFVLSLLVLRTKVEGRVLPHFRQLTANWENTLKLASQGLAYALDIALFTLSLNYCSLSRVLLLRASTPLWTALLSGLVHRHQRKFSVWLCIFGVAAGGVLSLFHDSSFHLQQSELVGLGLALGSVIMSSLVLVLAEFIMVKGDLDALNLTFYSSLPTALFLFPFFVVQEATAVFHYLNQHFWFNVIIVCSSSILVFALTVSRYQLVRLTSSVYSASVPNVRAVLVLIGIEIVSGGEEKLHLLQQAGIVLCILCFLYLSFLGFSEAGYQLPSYSDRVLHFGRQLQSLLRGLRHSSHTTDSSIEFELLEDSNSFVDEKDRRFIIGDISEEEEQVDDDDDETAPPPRDKGKAEDLEDQEQSVFIHYQNGDSTDDITPYHYEDL